jgi:hypothetical protein
MYFSFLSRHRSVVGHPRLGDAFLEKANPLRGGGAKLRVSLEWEMAGLPKGED